METDARPIDPILMVGDLVHEADGDHETPARIIEVIRKHGRTYYRVHFKNRAILNKVILPDYRLIKYKNMQPSILTEIKDRVRRSIPHNQPSKF